MGHQVGGGGERERERKKEEEEEGTNAMQSRESARNI